MWWWTDGSWWPFWLLMPALMVTCALLMARMMRGGRGMGGMGMCGFGRHGMDHGGAGTAAQIFDERLARGEIDLNEHDRLRKALTATSSRSTTEANLPR
jgi:uncharacterized membrane protein